MHAHTAAASWLPLSVVLMRIMRMILLNLLLLPLGRVFWATGTVLLGRGARQRGAPLVSVSMTMMMIMMIMLVFLYVARHLCLVINSLARAPAPSAAFVLMYVFMYVWPAGRLRATPAPGQRLCVPAAFHAGPPCTYHTCSFLFGHMLHSVHAAVLPPCRPCSGAIGAARLGASVRQLSARAVESFVPFFVSCQLSVCQLSVVMG